MFKTFFLLQCPCTTWLPCQKKVLIITGNLSNYEFTGHILLKKGEKSKGNSFYQQVLVNNSIEKVNDKECSYKLGG